MGLLGSLFGWGQGPGGPPGNYGNGGWYQPRGPYGGWYQPRGPYGGYPGCGCSSFFIVAAGILLVFGGLLRSCNM